MRSLLKWRRERKERKRREQLARLSEPGQAELQDLVDQQSPMKGKWGYFPK